MSCCRAVSRRGITNSSAPISSSRVVAGRGRNSRLAQQLGMATIVALGGAGQYFLGTGEDFFDHKFVTTKKPEDLADFYGTEDFMEVFCVLPFMVRLMMRGAEFDETGTIHSWGLLGPGELEVSIDFDEHEEDLDGDGEPETISWFNKKEHFRDVAPSFLGGFTLWEMTQNFGYRRLNDGTCEVYHHGEKFNGFFLVRLIFQFHSYYVIWATKRYVNSDAFGSEDRASEAEELRQNIPLHVFADFLQNLTREVENAQEEAGISSKKHAELEVTLQRLKTISKMDHKDSKPRLRAMRSHNTKVAHVQLVVGDKETKDAIRTAMKQIGDSKGHRHEPVTEIYELARRTTIYNQKEIKEVEDKAGK